MSSVYIRIQITMCSCSVSMKLSTLTGNESNVVYSSLSSTSGSVSPSDPTLTVDSVLEVMGKVQDWERVRGVLSVPPSKLDEIKEQSSTEMEQHLELTKYWVNTDPDPSWEKLGRVLYMDGEESAATMVKQYLPPQGM